MLANYKRQEYNLCINSKYLLKFNLRNLSINYKKEMFSLFALTFLLFKENEGIKKGT